MELTDAFGLLSAEIVSARKVHPKFNTAHEGYAVILEELEELKAEVFKKQHERAVTNMRREAIQVAAMGLRFAIDLT